MLIKILITGMAVLLLLMSWLLVQHFARAFSRKHPELGPLREEGEGCGSSCNCHNKAQCNKTSEASISD